MWNLEKSVENFDIFEILKIEKSPQQFSKFTLKSTLKISKFWKFPEYFGENFSDAEIFNFKIVIYFAVFVFVALYKSVSSCVQAIPISQINELIHTHSEKCDGLQ